MTGSNMEANTIYEGASASAKDIESGPGAGEIRYKQGGWLRQHEFEWMMFSNWGRWI